MIQFTDRLASTPTVPELDEPISEELELFPTVPELELVPLVAELELLPEVAELEELVPATQ